MIYQSDYETTFFVCVICCFQEVQGRPLRLNLAADKKPISPFVIDEMEESNVDRLEILFGVST